MAERRESLELLECLDTTAVVWQGPLGPHDLDYHGRHYKSIAVWQPVPLEPLECIDTRN
jgi:hypothetical protein